MFQIDVEVRGAVTPVVEELRNGLNYPPTDADRKFPSDVKLSINAVVVGQVQLPDEPADERGVLSHHNGVDPGSVASDSGYLVPCAFLPLVQLQSGHDHCTQIENWVLTLTLRHGLDWYAELY